MSAPRRKAAITMSDAPDPLTRRRFIVLSGQSTLLAGAGGFLAACGGSAKTSLPGTGGTLVQGYPSVPSQLDPGTFTGMDVLLTLGNVYATPMRFVKRDLGQGFPEVPTKDPQIEPWIAKSLEPSADLKTFKLVLRDDVVSSAGNPLIAEDVRWTIERNNAIAGNGQVVVQLAGLKNPRAVKVIDDHTLEFRLDAPNRLLPELLQNQFGFGIVDSVAAKKHATATDKYANAWLKRNTVGYGPYRVVEFTPQRMSFQPNTKNRLDKPAYRRIRWLAVPETSNRLSLIQSRDAQIVSELEPEQLRTVEGIKSVGTYATDAQAISDQLFFNMSVPELKDPRVRLALMHAIPSKGILAAVYRGTATPVETPLGGSQYRGADKGLNPITEDPAKAKQLLQAAGAGGLKLKLNFDTSSFWQKPAAIQLQTAWRAVGVQTELEGLPPSVWGERLGKKTMPVFMITLNWLIPDFFYVMNLLFRSDSGINFAGFKSPRIDALLAAGIKEADPAKRDQRAAEFQREFWRQPPAIALAVRKSVTAMTEDVGGYTAWINGMAYWSELKPKA
jgi:peptide/nickel transport system substrate-binding protein